MKALRTAVMQITPAEAVNLVATAGHHIMTVTFITRGTGEVRVMNGRRGVKGRKGGKLRYNPAEKGLISFFDMQIGQPRMIDCNTILSIKANNKEYIVQS
jgi:hypothetical protein